MHKISNLIFQQRTAINYINDFFCEYLLNGFLVHLDLNHIIRCVLIECFENGEFSSTDTEFYGFSTFPIRKDIPQFPIALWFLHIPFHYLWKHFSVQQVVVSGVSSLLQLTSWLPGTASCCVQNHDVSRKPEIRMQCNLPTPTYTWNLFIQSTVSNPFLFPDWYWLFLIKSDILTDLA